MAVGVPFAHLHVASGYSLRYGTATPDQLVTQASEHGQDILALTDRESLAGAVKFVQAASRAGIAPVLGVDLALCHLDSGPSGARSLGRSATPARGGAYRDLKLPRVTVLAHGSGYAAAGQGWSGLCHLVTRAHANGVPIAPALMQPALTADSLIQATSTGALTVLLGPDSPVGRAILARQHGRARAILEYWRDRLPGQCSVEVVCHDGPPGSVGSRRQAAEMVHLADAVGVPVVLAAAVRHLRAEDARVADIVDAARRLVVLHPRHLDRSGAAAHLASSAQMKERAEQIIAAARLPKQRGARLLQSTRELALRCVQSPAHDLGIGRVHLPEPSVIGLSPQDDPMAELAARCRAQVSARYPRASEQAYSRLADELSVIAHLGYPTYFLTVAQVVDLIRAHGGRVAARGSGAGSLVNYLLGISGVDPIEHDLLMERFCSPIRAELPDIDIDVESARRLEIYDLILGRFGQERVSCVSMMDTYRVRHAIRDVGAALGMPPAEIDQLAKSFPHIRARDARSAIETLPELISSGWNGPEMEQFWDLVQALDGLPRHMALHPCGVILSNATLLDRTPVQDSGQNYPMSQFDKDDVEVLGLLKLDVLGIRMQSAMAHAIDQIEVRHGVRIDLDDPVQVPLDDPATYAMIGSTQTLGCFQIESPGQRELIGKLTPRTFDDIIIDISLFRPGPVKSDMIAPFLKAREGLAPSASVHPSLDEALAGTHGVVVFHEQVLRIVAITAGVSLGQADEVRRTMGSFEGQERIEQWWRAAAEARGYSAEERDRIWEVLAAFASFGFCRAHAAAFALPTIQSAWLKTHYPAAFLAGVLTHDPGMYPKRLILDEARRLGIAILSLDVNRSTDAYQVEALAQGEGIRLSLADVRGMSQEQLRTITQGAPYAGLEDFLARSQASVPVTEGLVMAGAFDALHGIGARQAGRYGRLTRRDLLVHIAEYQRWARGQRRPGPGQLTLELEDAPQLRPGSGLRELNTQEKVSAELQILGMDASTHVMEGYQPMLRALGVTAAAKLSQLRTGSRVWVAGVKVATQTPPVRSGRRVVFLTLDDGTGPADATFFEQAQTPYAATVFSSWLLLVAGTTRRTGRAGISIQAEGAWELSTLWEHWVRAGIAGVHEALALANDQAREREPARPGQRVLRHASGYQRSPFADVKPAGDGIPTRKLWHASPGSSGR